MNSQANGLSFPFEPPPLRADEGGAVRIGKSRVTLDLVVEQYENGMAPEDLVRAYDTLDRRTFTPSSPTTSGTAMKCGPI